MVLWPDEGGRARTPEHMAAYSKKQKNILALVSESGSCLGFLRQALCILVLQLLTGTQQGWYLGHFGGIKQNTTDPVAYTTDMYFSQFWRLEGTRSRTLVSRCDSW